MALKFTKVGSKFCQILNKATVWPKTFKYLANLGHTAPTRVFILKINLIVLILSPFIFYLNLIVTAKDDN